MKIVCRCLIRFARHLVSAGEYLCNKWRSLKAARDTFFIRFLQASIMQVDNCPAALRGLFFQFSAINSLDFLL
jgi:hypothetical protein